MITGNPAALVHITYAEPEDLRTEMHRTLAAIRPVLEERKLSLSDYDSNIVGDRIRLLREGLSLSREEVAKAIGLSAAEAIRRIEESTDRLSNPSLLQLRKLAAVLHTTVADLVEPDLGARMMQYIESMLAGGSLSGRTAARFGRISSADQKRIIRRLLLRIIDSLEGE